MRAETIVRAAPPPAMSRGMQTASTGKELKAAFEIVLGQREEIFRTGAVIPFTIRQVGPRLKGIRLHAGTFRKDLFSKEPTTIQVNLRRIVLQIRIVAGRGMRDVYYPVGIAFQRADETVPIGRPWTTGVKCLPGSPFCDVRMNEPPGTIEITDCVSRVHASDDNDKYHCGTHRTYRFTVFVQNARTGAVGLIDPEIENSNAA